MAWIPGRNPQALVAYYLGFTALLPWVDLDFAIPPLDSGSLELRAVKREPAIEGDGHAIVGIVLAAIGLLIWSGLVLLSILASLASA